MVNQLTRVLPFGMVQAFPGTVCLQTIINLPGLKVKGQTNASMRCHTKK